MKKQIIIPVIVILALAVAALLYFTFRQHNEMKEMVEQMEFEKEQLEDEYQDLALQFDGYQTPDIHNDSLVQLLSQEKQRVQDLLEELRITKATSARRIAELKKELSTVRTVMVGYVHQIDSLDRTNKRLTRENEQVRQQYQEVTRQAEQLQQQNSELTEVVSRASMLEIADFIVTPLNKRDRKTSIFNQIQKVQFDFTILKNITTTPGQKTLYVRIVRPDGDLIYNANPKTFEFENKSIEYSIKKDFEYEGESLPQTIWWEVQEMLQKGTYNADIFIDGNLIASVPFKLQ